MQAIRSAVALAVALGLVVPLAGYASIWIGIILGWIIVIGGITLVIRFVLDVQAGLPHGDLPSTTTVLDVWMCLQLIVALAWYCIWIVDREEHVRVAGASDPYGVFMVLLYSTIIFRVRPLNWIAYVWGFLVLSGFMWLFAMAVTLYRRSLVLTVHNSLPLYQQQQQQHHATPPPQPLLPVQHNHLHIHHEPAAVQPQLPQTSSTPVLPVVKRTASQPIQASYYPSSVSNVVPPPHIVEQLAQQKAKREAAKLAATGLRKES